MKGVDLPVYRQKDRILDAMLEKAYVDDEDFKKSSWKLNAVSNASRRKTVREIKQLIDFK